MATSSTSPDRVRTAVPGALPLTAVATSQTNQAVRAAATADLSVPATLGLSAEFDPASVSVQQVGPTSFLLLVRNTLEKILERQGGTP